MGFLKYAGVWTGQNYGPVDVDDINDQTLDITPRKAAHHYGDSHRSYYYTLFPWVLSVVLLLWISVEKYRRPNTFESGFMTDFGV